MSSNSNFFFFWKVVILLKINFLFILSIKYRIISYINKTFFLFWMIQSRDIVLIVKRFLLENFPKIEYSSFKNNYFQKKNNFKIKLKIAIICIYIFMLIECYFLGKILKLSLFFILLTAYNILNTYWSSPCL